MRRKRLTHHNQEDLINMTPMLDVVFIMLIFFIVSTSFVSESGITVNRPTAKTATLDKQSGTIFVAIKPSGEIWVDNKKVDIKEVRPAIERLKVQNPESKVVLQADKDAKTGRLVEVMDNVRLAGIRNIAIAAENN